MKSIKLLNSETYKKADILKKMYSDDYYYNFLGKVTLSSSLIKKLLKSPKSFHYTVQYGDPVTTALLMGRLLHLSVLEPQEFDKYTFVDCQSRVAKKYKDYVKNNIDRKHTIFTMKEKTETERLQDALYRNEQAMKLLTKCDYEVPEIGYIGGLPFRGKADILCKDRLVDLKTTANIEMFTDKYSSYGARKLNYDVQVFIYCTLFNKSYKEFKFLVIDKQTLDIGIFDVSKEFFESGKEKTFEAIGRYKQFFQEEVDLDSYTLRGTL